MGGGVKPPRGTNNPGVEEFPRGEKTFGVTLEGKRVLGTDRRGRGGDRKSSSTRDINENTATSRIEEMTSRQDPAAMSSAPRGTAYGGRGRSTQVSTKRNSDGTDGARPKNGALMRHEYRSLVPEGPAGDLAAAGPNGSG